jgi:hypothetical protein
MAPSGRPARSRPVRPKQLILDHPVGSLGSVGLAAIALTPIGTPAILCASAAARFRREGPRASGRRLEAGCARRGFARVLASCAILDRRP